jgi:hypothetical protein
MEGLGQTLPPYAYPAEPHTRRHGPSGYTDYHSYRPWLEDEFFFRCVYCLKRMVWAPAEVWAVDHLISQAKAQELECEYTNLVLVCPFCNGQKGPNGVPDPCEVAYGKCLRVESDGRVTPFNAPGHRLVKVLGLNHEKQIAERRKQIRILEVLAIHNRGWYEQLMGFPAELPDLRKLNPPNNRRPEGVSESCHAKRQRGELPTIY